MTVLRILAFNIAILLTLIAAVDVAGYYVIPNDWYFNGYKSKLASQTIVGSGFYPRDYFEENVTRGFDIRPPSHGVSITADYLYPIEANELGCRDRHVSFDPEKPLIYAAGDSQTWGFIPTDARWTNVLEEKVGLPVLNCGVPGTGQYHQHAKYGQVVGLLKRRPDLVLVAYVSNDVGDDSAFPAFTVVKGILAPNKWSSSDDKAGLEALIARLDNPTLVDRLSNIAKRYSLSAQIIRALWYREIEAWTALPVDSEYDYSDAVAAPNEKAIMEFGKDVCSNGSRFAILVLPDARHLQFPDYFAGLDDFLRNHGIFAIDFHRRASKQGLRNSDFAQLSDPHFSELGNLRFANELYETMEKDGETFGSCEHLSSPPAEAVGLVR